MKEFIRSQWAKARRSLASAEAILAGRGMEFTKHTAVRAALHRDLIQARLLPADLGREHNFLRDLRETADYGGVRRGFSSKCDESDREVQGHSGGHRAAPAG